MCLLLLLHSFSVLLLLRLLLYHFFKERHHCFRDGIGKGIDVEKTASIDMNTDKVSANVDNEAKGMNVFLPAAVAATLSSPSFPLLKLFYFLHDIFPVLSRETRIHAKVLIGVDEI